MFFYGLRAKSALSLVRQSRTIVEPNFGFWRQILDYEKQLFWVSSENCRSNYSENVGEIENDKEEAEEEGAVVVVAGNVSYPLEEYIFDSFREVWFPDSGTRNEEGENEENEENEEDGSGGGKEELLEEQRRRAQVVIREMMERYGGNMFELENVLYDYQFI